MTAPESKTCTKCGETKPLSDYYRSSQNKADGFNWKCKACVEAYKRARLGRDRAQKAVYWKRYYAAHGDAVRERWRTWARENPEKRQASRTPAQLERQTRRRRARLLAAFVEDVSFDYIVQRDQGVCGICREPVMEETVELDHIVPLALGGLHERNNVQLSHRSCNRRKAANLDGQIHLPV